jgi:hypothetical protein
MRRCPEPQSAGPRLFVPLALLGWLLSACPGNLEDPGRFTRVDGGAPPSCIPAEVPQRILVPACATEGCHVEPARAAGLDLASPGLAERLIDVAGSSCGGRPLVDRDRPERSQMYDRLLVGTECGLRMPLGAMPLSETDQECVLEWIELLVTSTTSTSGLAGGGR